jgi:hypothetical protein
VLSIPRSGLFPLVLVLHSYSIIVVVVAPMWVVGSSNTMTMHHPTKRA